ncbi:MAG: YqhA family protein [Anaerolineae bacterium]|nr:YqhA family protein [Anaerolineae bacterium]
MKQILEKSTWLTIIAVFASLLASVAAYVMGVLRTISLIGDVIAGKPVAAELIALIELTDIFLIATTLLIFALALYELFIGKLDLPEWLIVHHFTELKDKISAVIVLVMAVSFLKILLDGKYPAADILAFGIGIGAVITALGLFARLNKKPDDKKAE